MTVKVTSLSSKGQVVIPSEIRNKLGLTTGSNLVILTDGSNLLLKPIKKPQLKTFERLIEQSRKLAKATGLKKSDVEKTIRKVRNESRS